MTANYVAIARGSSEGRIAAWLHSTFSNARLPVLENWGATPSNILALYGTKNFITYIVFTQAYLFSLSYVTLT